MKKNILFFAVLLLLMSCNLSNNGQNTFSIAEIDSKNYESYGGKVSSENIHNKKSIAEQYKTLKEGDTVTIAFSSTVNNVCKAKGCWMKVTLGDDKETMVKFKDYGFFVPKDIENDTVIVQGKAYVSEVSVEEQRHFASDAGKTDEEIASITTPKKTYSFIADGVLIKN
ncbi:DUF4920 domain-containing protein [Aquimarina algiphila]|uniref:DUF4920 domain-containing protein n=1 Tax=Aquimarina algiphila TaxID=2047982 RepID=UPI00248F6EEC|nr:DUF4920 domain-containing protein [Aquimarina algiphila]